MDAQQLTKPRELSREQKHELWVQWLNDLAVWERHWVFIHCELDWHDEFVDGDMPLSVYREILDKEFSDANLHSVKV